MLANTLKWIFIRLIVAVISLDIGVAGIFSRPRKFVSDRAHEENSGIFWRFLQGLITCSFCLSHWFAFPLALYFKLQLLPLPGIGWYVGLILSPFAAVWLSSKAAHSLEIEWKRLGKEGGKILFKPSSREDSS
jgi:hypothetical protein